MFSRSDKEPGKTLASDGKSFAAIGRTSGLLIGALALTVSLTGCDEEKAANGSANVDGDRSFSVIGSIRPKQDRAVIDRMRQEQEEARRQQMIAAAQAQQQNQPGMPVLAGNMDPANRDLPAVDQTPISPLPSPPATPQSQSPLSAITNALGLTHPQQVPTPPPMQTATYGGYQSSPGAFIPPPPAVSLTTAAQPMADPYQQAYASGAYGNPYANPYANPYMQQQQPAYSAPQPAHPAGSMFSNGGGTISGAKLDTSVDDNAKRRADIVIITPTGMDPRSPYKQRDDLKILIKGALASAPELRDAKIQAQLTKVDVGLPTDPSKGNFNMQQRQIDSLFKAPAVDRRILPQVKKVATESTQAYYRYLYAHNKYALTQQTIKARKQESEMAETAAERQRAAADLSAAQEAADGAKEELKGAQIDLASASGAQAARSIITKVSGAAPSLESLCVNETADAVAPADDGIMGSVSSALNVFNVFGKKGEAPKAEKVAAAPPKEKAVKEKKKGKSKEEQVKVASEAPVQESEPSPPPEKPAAISSRGIVFELRNVQTTPKKSVLKVSIRNNGSDSINFDTEAISVVDGDRKLAEGSVRTEFDTTQVGPNQEVTGQITIFGRPWNDKLTVSLLDGGKTINLHR